MAEQIKFNDAHDQCSECYAFDREHYPDCSELKPFPIQKGGKIPWWLAKEAYAFYHSQWPGQSLEQLAGRGGFGADELLMLLRRQK
jgi:hypothetical protein